MLKPKAEKYGKSRIVISDTAEIIRKEGKKYEDNGYLVVEMNLTNDSSNPQYNPFVMFRSDRDIMCFVDELVRQAEAQILGDRISAGSAGDPHRLLLSALIMYLYHYTKRNLFNNMHSVAALLRAAEIDEHTLLDEKSDLDNLFKDVERRDPEFFACAMYKSWKMLPEAWQKQSVAFCAQILYGFENDDCRENETYNAWADLLHRKVALYIICSPYDRISMLKANLLLWQIRYAAAKERTYQFDKETDSLWDAWYHTDIQYTEAKVATYKHCDPSLFVVTDANGEITTWGSKEYCAEALKTIGLAVADENGNTTTCRSRHTAPEAEAFAVPDVLVSASMAEYFQENVYVDNVPGEEYKPYFFDMDKYIFLSGKSICEQSEEKADNASEKAAGNGSSGGDIRKRIFGG